MSWFFFFLIVFSKPHGLDFFFLLEARFSAKNMFVHEKMRFLLEKTRFLDETELKKKSIWRL